MSKKAVSLLSGGLDSATATAIALDQGYEVLALSFHYGQRHSRELVAAQTLVQYFGIKEHYITDINLAQWGGSSLVDSEQTIPLSGVDSQVIPSTYVPGRNTVFIAIALSLAEAKGAECVFLGINSIDYSGYPDCRPEYLSVYQQLARLSSRVGVEGHPIELVAPLVTMTKVDIIRKALELNVPVDLTWSCYQGGDQPCGVCDSCRIRNEAFLQLDLCKEL